MAEVDPIEALLGLLAEAVANVAALRGLVTGGVDVTDADGLALLALYGEERDRAARVAKAAVDPAVEHIRDRVHREGAARIAAAIGRVLDSNAADLSREQQTALRHAIADELRGPATVAAPKSLGKGTK